MSAQDHTGRPVVVTVLQGAAKEWHPQWEMIVVKTAHSPMMCNICERPLEKIEDIGAWRLHSCSPVCAVCVETYQVEETEINELAEERINPPGQ